MVSVEVLEGGNESVNTAMCELIRDGTRQSRRLTGGDVGGGVGVGQTRHLAGQAGLTGPAVEAEVRNPRRCGQGGVLAVHVNVRVMSVGCWREGKKRNSKRHILHDKNRLLSSLSQQHNNPLMSQMVELLLSTL